MIDSVRTTKDARRGRMARDGGKEILGEKRLRKIDENRRRE